MERYVAMLSALGHGARLAIFRCLVKAGPEGGCVEEIQQEVGIPPSTLSHHLDALRRGGLLVSQRHGRFIRYRIDVAGLADLLRFLTEDCCAGLARTEGARGVCTK